MIRLVQLLSIDILNEVAKSGAPIPTLTIGKMEQQIIDNSGGKVGPHSTNYRVSNLKDITDKKFVNIIKKAFPPVKKVDVIDSGVGDNKSGAFKLFKWTWGKKDYKVYLAGPITGRGTKQTRDQELSWLLVLSVMQYGVDPSAKESYISAMMDETAWKPIEGMTEDEALHLAAFLENNDDWYKSHVSQCKKMIAKTGMTANKQPIKYWKDSSSLKVNNEAKKLYQNDLLSGKRPNWSLDKWNPADVWLEYGKVPTDKTTLADYNNWLLNSLKNGKGWVGISLKKSGAGAAASIVNGRYKKVYKFNDINLRYGYLFSQGVECIYKGGTLNGLGLAFRIFQGKVSELIRGEGTSKSADAVQGKVALHVLDTTTSGIVSAVNSVKGESVKYVKDPNGKKKTDKIWEWTPNGLSRFNSKVQSAYKTVKDKGANFDDTKSQGIWSDAFKSSDKFIKAINNWKTTKKENSIKANISSRFQTLVLGSKLMGLSPQKRNEVMIGLLRYGKSESEWSAPHYKAQ